MLYRIFIYKKFYLEIIENLEFWFNVTIFEFLWLIDDESLTFWLIGSVFQKKKTHINIVRSGKPCGKNPRISIVQNCNVEQFLYSRFRVTINI